MKENRLRSLKDRITHPSSTDGPAVLGKLVPASVILGLAGMIRHVAPVEADVIAHVGHQSANTLEDLSKKARLAAIPGVAAAGVIFAGLSYQEMRNRVLYGDHLTVSKVAPRKKYFGRILFPELQNQRFVGELHYQGKWAMRYSSKDNNKRAVMRAAFHDLHELASAVEKNDPRLEDFDYFVGLSDMINPLFERFGFTVEKYKDQLGLPPLGQNNQKDIVLQMRPIMAMLINKEDLVRNKQKLAKASHLPVS